MAKYTVLIHQDITHDIQVEADDENQALEKVLAGGGTVIDETNNGYIDDGSYTVIGPDGASYDVSP